MHRQREWGWQWDKLPLFYERLESEDEGALVDVEVGLEEEVGRRWVGEGLGVRRQWVEEWVEEGHRHHNTIHIEILTCSSFITQ